MSYQTNIPQPRVGSMYREGSQPDPRSALVKEDKQGTTKALQSNRNNQKNSKNQDFTAFLSTDEIAPDEPKRNKIAYSATKRSEAILNSGNKAIKSYYPMSQRSKPKAAIESKKTSTRNPKTKSNINKLKAQKHTSINLFRTMDESARNKKQPNKKAHRKYNKSLDQRKSKRRGSSTSSKRTSTQRSVNRTKPYGFRSSATRPLPESPVDKKDGQKEPKYPESLKSLKQEYFSNKGVISQEQIFNSLFHPKEETKQVSKASQKQLTERLMRHKENVNIKIKEQQIQKSLTKQGKPEKPKPSSDHSMYDHQKEKDLKKKARMVEIVLSENRKEMEELKQAQASDRSKKILKKSNRRCKGKGSIHNRLYRMSKHSRPADLSENSSRIHTQVAEGTTPSKDAVHKKYNDHERAVVTDRLMEDATKRLKTKKYLKNEAIKSIKKKAKPSKTTKTQNYAFKRFIKEYENVLIDLSKERAEDFTFEELCQVLLKMGFVSPIDEIDKNEGIVADVWIMMGGETQNIVSEKSIYHILCIILNFEKNFLYNENPDHHGLHSSEELPENDKNTVGIINDNGVFYLRNKQEFNRLHGYFYDLTFNRINHTNKMSQEKSRMNDASEFQDKALATFQPKINSVSESIEMNKTEQLGKVPRHELLLNKGKAYKEAQVHKEAAKKDKELDGCTFAPNTVKKRNRLPKRTTRENKSISIEEAKSNFINSLRDFNVERETSKQEMRSHRGSKAGQRPKPKVNQVILDIISTKDPVVQSEEIFQQYNTIQNEANLAESQQSSSLMDKISIAQQCYKEFDPPEGLQENMKKYCHNQDERISQIEIEERKYPADDFYNEQS